MLLKEGYTNYAKRKAAEGYTAEKITTSRAAEKAGITAWEMEQYLIAKGFKSQYSIYSIADLKEEMGRIKAKRRGLEQTR
jgi:hypothetical protein